MTLRAIGVAVLVTSCLACAGQPPAKEAEPEGPFGTLKLNLTGSDSRGVQYRLREAEFDVAPYGYYPYPGGPNPNTNAEIITLSTETDPDASTLTARVLPGTYTVTLSNRLWFLEKLTDEGYEPVDKAVLLSEASQYVYVYDRSTTDLYFTFGVGGEVIDFRHGDININIRIEHPDEDGGVPPDPDQDAGTDIAL